MIRFLLHLTVDADSWPLMLTPYFLLKTVRLRGPVREAGAGGPGVGMLGAQDLLADREQGGVLVAGTSRIPRLPRCIGEVGTDVQGGGVRRGPRGRRQRHVLRSYAMNTFGATLPRVKRAEWNYKKSGPSLRITASAAPAEA